MTHPLLKLYAIPLLILFVSFTAPAPFAQSKRTRTKVELIGHNNQPLPFLRKLLRWSSLSRHTEHYAETEVEEQQDELGRQLLQFVGESAPGVSPLPPLVNIEGDFAPGPSPAGDFPVSESPPVSPFVPSTEGKACCCKSGSIIIEEEYVQPTPPGCCCGNRNQCCTSNGLISMICGGGHVCGILMMLSALFAVLVVCFCITGSFLARRRRMRAMQLAAANGGVPGFDRPLTMQRPGYQALEIPADQIPTLTVRAASPADCVGAEGMSSDGLDALHPNMKECPICLESIAVQPTTWAVFPCSHGCCRPCLSDLLRLSSRRVNDAMLAVNCPLCRKMAVAPEGQLPLPGEGSDAQQEEEERSAPQAGEEEQQICSDGAPGLDASTRDGVVAPQRATFEVESAAAPLSEAQVVPAVVLSATEEGQIVRQANGNVSRDSNATVEGDDNTSNPLRRPGHWL